MRFCSNIRLICPTPTRVGCCLVLLGLLLGSGCQNRPAGWRLLNFGRAERVPPPGTGTLNIPQFNPVLGTSPTTPIGMPSNYPSGVVYPGSYTPTSTPMMNPGLSTPPTGAIPTGAIPNVPGIGVSPWNTSAVPNATNNPSGVPTYAQIPDRGMAASFPNSGVANPTVGLDRTTVPQLLPGGFDPYDTSRIPTWSAGGGAGFGSSPLVTTSLPTTPPGAQEGFWPGQTQPPGSPNSPAGFGSGQLWGRLFGGNRFQPANATGYATTTPIDNPMIPVTSGYANQPPVGSYPVQPVGYASPSSATPGNGLSYAQWRAMQNAAQAQAQQQAAWQQAQWVNQQRAQAAALLSGPGAGSYQVLAENSTSRTAENQARFGYVAPAGPSVNPNYGGPAPVAPSAQPLSGQAPPMFRSAGQPLQVSDSNRLQSGWQSNGVR